MTLKEKFSEMRRAYEGGGMLGEDAARKILHTFNNLTLRGGTPVITTYKDRYEMFVRCTGAMDLSEFDQMCRDGEENY